MFKSLLGLEDKFLLLEVEPEKTRGWILALNKEKALTLKKPLSFSANEMRLKVFSNLPIIISLAPSLSFTNSLPLNFEREEPGISLERTELENMVAQAVSKVFNQCREEASRHLETDDLNVVLAEGYLGNFYVDGHRVISPLGFRAKNIRAFLGLSFTARNVLDKLRPFLKENKTFFTNLGKAELEVVRKVKESPARILIFNPEGRLFILDNPDHPAFREISIAWREDCFYDLLGKDWDISRLTAKDIYQQYLQGEVSSGMARHFKKIFQPAIYSLLEKLKKRGVRGRLYFNSSFQLPFAPSLKSQSILLEEINLDYTLEKLGFKIDRRKWGMTDGEIFRRLAPFWDFYYNEENNEVNKWLRRRLHWLGASL